MTRSTRTLSTRQEGLPVVEVHQQPQPVSESVQDLVGITMKG